MSTLYQIYHESVIRLAATLVVKDEATCSVINQRLSLLGHTVLEDQPHTWKYYLNLAGQYHPTDTMMTVVSMDTHETIEFTTANMTLHRATWREYQYGSRYYKELLARYPAQDALIHGILNPVDLNTAIAAPDHTILYHDAAEVEAREVNLIPELQKWINAQFVRWANDDYRINNAYFITARLGVMFMAMPEVIKSIRSANARTNRVHSYHIRRYLASFGPLDQYYDSMNEFQRLYFYRNIRYILNNNGKDEMFQELVGKVMTERKFPLAEYVMQQNDAPLLEQMDPEIQFERISVNNIPSALGEDIKTPRMMLSLQRTLARSNEEENFYAEQYVPEAMTRSLTAEVRTKSLESNVLDLKESEPYTLSEVLLNHWIYLADTGQYRTVLIMQLPDGGDGIKLSMKEAYLVYQYLYFKRMGIELVEIPRVMAKRVRRQPLPSFEELRALTTRAVTSDAFIHEALRDNETLTSYVSVDAFLKLCQALQRRMLLHRDLYVYREDLFQYGEIKLLTDRFYADIPVDMDHGQYYADWLRARSLDFEKYSQAELDEIMLGILNQATGLELRTAQTVKDIQAAMLGIMSQLSSYSVHYIQQINEDAVVMFDWPHLRWNYPGGWVGHDIRIPVVQAEPLEFYGAAKLKASIDLSNMTIQDLARSAAHDFGLDIGLEFGLSGLNQFLEGGMVLNTLVTTITAPALDLNQLDGTTVTIPALVNKPIADLFDRTVSNDFVNP